MNYSGNMPDWHQYNSPQSAGSEISSIGQNVNHSPIFGPGNSPRRINGPNFSPEGLNKPQNDTSFIPRNFQQSPNTLNGPNSVPDNSAIGSVVQIPGCHGHYGAPSPRNTMIEGTNAPLDSRNVSVSSLNDTMGQRSHQLSMHGPTAHLNCPTMNGSMGPMGQRSTATNLQGPIPATTRQGPGSYIACKGPCCNPDTNLSYQNWEKFSPYPPNVPYRENAGYPVDNRRFGNDFNVRKDGFENREQLNTSTYNVDSRRNFPDYKYRKDPIVSRGYAHPSSVIQNYPVQNYNFPTDYQKYSTYPVKEYPRDNSIANPQNPAILKYQEQSVIVQQKYFTKQIQYQNGAIPKTIVPTNMAGNIISRAQNPYFNPQLARDFPRDYSESSPLSNRSIQTASPVHAAYPKYQMYQQKIAMQRFSMENHLRELTRIPGYQTHPKYQECVLRYRELLRLQQTVDYQSTIQDTPRVVTSQVNEEIPPINLQFDQNGVLINSSFAATAFSSQLSPIDLQNSKPVQNVSNSGEVRAQNLQHPQQFETEVNLDATLQDQRPSSIPQTASLHEQYSNGKDIEQDKYNIQKYESESLHVVNAEDGKTLSLHHRNSKDFADKPELDVRQFLANWDESEDEDGANANLPDVVLSNSTPVLVVEYENTKNIPDIPGESENCSETQDCQDTDDCEMLENAQNKTKSSDPGDDQIYNCDLATSSGNSKPLENIISDFNSRKNTTRTGTVIQSTDTGTVCENERTSHIMEDLENSCDINTSVKPLCDEKESSNENEDREGADASKIDINTTIESTIENESTMSEAYKQENNSAACSSNAGTVGSDDTDVSSCEAETSEHTKSRFRSDDDLSESDRSDSIDIHSMSSFMKSPKTIKGTEIHVDARELSAMTSSPKTDSDILDSPNLQKPSSFVSEESHNPDDISLPDLPTSECTPISTTLNTPIHSDSEESSEPVIDLTIPANPIEIIQNSPMLSFTHSPIKMEPYEHLDENEVTDKTSHDALDFDFQGSSSCDNDIEKLTDVSSHITEHCIIPQNHEDTFDSDCIEILPEREHHISSERNIRGTKTNNVVSNNVSQYHDSADQNRFTPDKGNVMATHQANTSTRVIDAERKPWSSITVKEQTCQISNNTNHQKTKTDTDNLETLSEMKDGLCTKSEVAKHHSNDDTTKISNTDNHHSTSGWAIKRLTETSNSQSPDNITALNLVKVENNIKSESTEIIDEIGNSQAASKESQRPFSYQNDCNLSNKKSGENQRNFVATERSEVYASSSSTEDEIYAKSVENEGNFGGSLNIPLIPGEEFEEPKMPVLPMEGNCLTKIIKNTSPITDLDVLGSDDEKLDKMDEIWMEVGSVDTVSKVTDVNTDSYTVDYGEKSDREKNLYSKNKLLKLHKNKWKHIKSSAKEKNTAKSLKEAGKESKQKNITNTTPLERQLIQTADSGIAQKGTNEDCAITGRTDNFAAILENKHNITKTSIASQSAIINRIDRMAAILKEKHNISKVPIVLQQTGNTSFSEDGNPSRNVCLENNATEIIKCQEKTNHINDIATKLLNNARLFDPEPGKTEELEKSLSCAEIRRDSSKKRIQLLKKFRKVKKTTISDSLTFQPTKSVDKPESSSAPFDEETLKTNSEIVKKPNADVKIPSAVDSDSFDCQVMEKMHSDEEENMPLAVSSSIAEPEERESQISCESKRMEENSELSKDTCIVNNENCITIEHNNNSDSHKNLSKKIVDFFDEESNEYAINLSKSSNDLVLLQTSNEKGCVSNDSYNPQVSEYYKTEESTEIQIDNNEKSADTKPQDGQYSFPESKHVEQNILCRHMVREDDKSLKVNHMEVEKATEVDHECNFTTSSTGLQEHTAQNQQSSIISDHEEPEKVPNEPSGNSEDLSRVSDNSEKLVNDICRDRNDSAENFQTEASKLNPCESKETSHQGSNIFAADDEEKHQKNFDTISRLELSGNPDLALRNAINTSAESEEDSIKIEARTDDMETNAAASDIHTNIATNSIENVNNISAQKLIWPIENDIELRPPPQETTNIDKIPDAKHLLDHEIIVVSDCSTNAPKNLQNKESISNIAEENFQIIDDIQDKSAICSRSKESLVKVQSEQPTTTESSKNANLDDIDLPSGTDRSTVDTNLDAFGIENSFDCDFNNFDVAPNIIDNMYSSRSNNWKYSKAYARYKDCERYKNPDNLSNPILPSLENLDNLNTVPVYTTKDGKITYSPNPKYTYRALIVEAREREGYSGTRESYYGNLRTQETLNHLKNQPAVRKRKISGGYTYAGGHGKKSYSEHHEPRDHGESSTKNSTDPWNRNHFNHNKYHHPSRDRNSHHFLPRNGTQEKSLNRYKHREMSTVFDEHGKRNNGATDTFECSNRKPYKQSCESSISGSTSSRSKRGLKYAQNILEDISSRGDIIPTHETENKNLESIISIEKCATDSSNDNQSKFFLQLDELALSKTATDKISTNENPVEEKTLPAEAGKWKSKSPKVENECFDGTNLKEISTNEVGKVLNLKSDLFSSECKTITCDRLADQLKKTAKIATPIEPLLKEVEEDYNTGKASDELYDEIEGIWKTEITSISENKLDGSSLLNFIKSSVDDRYDGPKHNLQDLNIEKTGSPINNPENRYASRAIPVEPLQADKVYDSKEEPDSAEMINESASVENLKTEGEYIYEKDKPKEPQHADLRTNSKSLEKSSLEMIEMDLKVVAKEEINVDEKIGADISVATDLKQIDVKGSNDVEPIPGTKELCNAVNIQESIKRDKKEAKTKPNRVKSETKSGTSTKSPRTENDESLSSKSIIEHENLSKNQSQFNNYIAFSPLNESLEDTKVIPKLVIKKTDSLTCKNVCSSSVISHDSFTEKMLDKDEQVSKAPVMQPKIPKILIRNAKSRPTTPSIEEVTEKGIFSSSTREDNKVPKVKIRFEDKRPKSPAISSNENMSNTDVTELTKIPKMKIKIDDRQPKMFIENVNTDSSKSSNENTAKTVPKMKIKTFKGALRSIVDAQILPVSIPRMFIRTDLEYNKQSSPEVTNKIEVDKSDINTKSPNLIVCDQETMVDSDKKIPKLKIKRKSSGCSVESTKKRHAVNPIQSELKKLKKSMKLVTSNDKKQSSKPSLKSEHHENLKKREVAKVKESYNRALARELSGSAEYSGTVQPVETTKKVEAEKSAGLSIPERPEEIPKVIIKRASPSAEFKCEFSKDRREALIKNKKWQPEVKLQRSWVLDCMAKDLNLDNLTLKVVTPESILKKCLLEKRPRLKNSWNEIHHMITNRSNKELFRSKSASDLLVAHDSIDTFAASEVDLTNSSRVLIARKRCKSDLGTSFTEYSRNFDMGKRYEVPDLVSPKREQIDASGINSAKRSKLQTDSEALITTETSKSMANEGMKLNTTVDENMNSKNECLDINLVVKSIDSISNVVLNDVRTGESDEGNCSDSCYSSLKQPSSFEILTDSDLIGNTDTDISKEHPDSKEEDSNEVLNADLTYTKKTPTNVVDEENSAKIDQTIIVRPNDDVPNKSVISQEVIPGNMNINTLNNDSEIGCSENLQKCFIPTSILNNHGENSTDEHNVRDALNNIRKKNDYEHTSNEDSTSCTTSVEEMEDSTLHQNVLNSSDSSSSNATKLANPNMEIIIHKELDDVDSAAPVKPCEETQTIIDILSGSPTSCQNEVEVQSSINAYKDNEVCLYHEDAIPTQFELELEITDNVVADSPEVAVPQDDYFLEYEIYSIDELRDNSHRSGITLGNSEDNVIPIDSKCQTVLPVITETDTPYVDSISTNQEELSSHPKEECINSTSHIVKKQKNRNVRDKNVTRFYAADEKSYSCSDLLVKEVLAAKETLRKCLAKSRSETRFKIRARPKTAAEKKQGSSFDLTTLTPSRESYTKIRDHSPINSTAGAENYQNVDNVENNENPFQIQTKTEVKVNTPKSERKHSKGSKNNLMQKKYNSSPTDIQEYRNVTQIEEYLYPNHSSIDIEESIDFSKGEKTISLKNSKYLIKNNSYSDSRKKMPELINSKDNKCKSKSSRHDINSTNVGKSKNIVPITSVRESSVNSGQCEEIYSSDTTKYEYKSSKNSVDQNVNSLSDKTRFKFYKIPKIARPTQSGSDKSNEELRGSHNKDVGMPILEPQVYLSGSSKASELNNVDRENSRSPPVITNQETEESHEITIRNLGSEQCQLSAKEEEENKALMKQSTISFDKMEPEVAPSYDKESTVADIVNDMAYHEKATIRHRRYCTLCERWFPTVARHRRHLTGYQHRHTELTQRRTIHALFTLFTGRPCPRLQSPSVVRVDCEPGELTPLQIAVQGVTKESNKVDGNIKKPTKKDK